MATKTKNQLRKVIAELRADQCAAFGIDIRGLTIQLKYQRAGWEWRYLQLAKFNMTGHGTAATFSSLYGAAMHRRDQKAAEFRQWIIELESENV